MKGYDIDGVITKGIIPEKDAVIITGRSFEEKEKTEKMLKEKGIFNNVVFCPTRIIDKTHITSGNHKARIIKELGVTEFYEDEERQIKIIKEFCPDVKVNWIEPKNKKMLDDAFKVQNDYYDGKMTELRVDKDYSYFAFNHPDADTFLPGKEYTIALLFSGGIDSYVAYLYAKKKYSKMNIVLVYVDYGYPYAQAEKETIKQLGLENEVNFIDYSFLKENQERGEKLWGEIFPGRNWILAVTASEFIENRGEIWMIAIGGEVKKQWGDKSEYFFENTSRILTEQLGRHITIDSPFRDKTKGEIIQWYIQRGYDIEILKNKTIGCHFVSSVEQKPCGQCMGCAHRYVGMKWNDIDEEYVNDVKAYAKKIYGNELDNPFSNFSEQRKKEIIKAIT